MDFSTPSTKGTFIKCTYKLAVKFSNRGFALGSKIPPIIIPITIYHPLIFSPMLKEDLSGTATGPAKSVGE